MKYPKAFDEYWKRAHVEVGQIEYWRFMRVKHAAFLAWKAGRKSVSDQTEGTEVSEQSDIRDLGPVDSPIKQALDLIDHYSEEYWWFDPELIIQDAFNALLAERGHVSCEVSKYREALEYIDRPLSDDLTGNNARAMIICAREALNPSVSEGINSDDSA